MMLRLVLLSLLSSALSNSIDPSARMVEQPPTPYDTWIGILVTSVATLGVVFNGYGIIIVKNNAILANSFGQFCLYHSIANIGICLAFLLWVAPMTLMQDEETSTSLPGKIISQMARYCWNVSLYSHLFVSLDRLISIGFPLKAQQLASTRRSKVFTLSPWVISLIHAVPNFWYNSCYMVYYPSDWAWKYPKDTQCGRVLPVFNMYKNFALIGGMALLDLFTLFFLHRHHKNMAHCKAGLQPNRCANREIRFFIQTLVQGGIFVLEQLNFHIFRKFGSGPLYTFFFTTFTWLLCHVLDGLVLIIFQVRGYENQRRLSISSQRSIVSVVTIPVNDKKITVGKDNK